jgi:predicted amidohydrolase YtcJ
MDILSNGKLREWALDADKNHLQISVHAIGDSANFLILNLFEEIIKTNPGIDDLELNMLNTFAFPILAVWQKWV